ncbi:MAG: lipoprotein-releasing system permease protein [Verrucomicrobia bacterium]|jgi:lipoprotein-releasing system permease protein|nr:lipoprotein-releasing system permease protein [Verrucomicrobiota bacterium]
MLALRYLRPKRTYVSVITLLSTIGITLGVAILIIVISVMSGFDKEWHEKIIGFSAHLKVARADDTMEDWALVRSKVEKNSQVAGVAPFVVGKVMIRTEHQSGKQQIDAPYLRGIEPQMETTISVLSNSIVRGNYDVSGYGLVIGVELARSLDLDVGDRLSVYSPVVLQDAFEKKKEGEELPLPEDYEIKGIFDVGFADFNMQYIVSSLENAQDLYALKDSVHGLMIKLHDPLKAAQVQDELLTELGPEFRAVTWMQENEHLFSALVVEKNMIRFLLFFIVIVASFCITCSLITFVVQKTHEIGILKALGASSTQIMSLFLIQSTFVGALGVGAGFAMGFTALHWRNEFLSLMNRITGSDLLNAGIYQLYNLPVLIIPSDLLIIGLGSLLISLGAGVIPALIAARMKPVEALRHE